MYGKSLSHPVRIKFLELATEKAMSPSRAVKKHNLDVPVSNVSYHTSQLLELGLIRAVWERPWRGSIENFYTATKLGEGVLQAAEEIARTVAARAATEMEATGEPRPGGSLEVVREIVQGDILAFVLSKHPAQLSADEILAKVGDGDHQRQAIEDLVTVGLLQCVDNSVLPTGAALLFEKLR